MPFVFSGCSEKNVTEEENLDTHVCEHLENGPAANVTAAADIDTALQAAQDDPSTIIQHVLHTRYDVSLPAVDRDTFEGYVTYIPIAADGEYAVYLDSGIPVTVFDTTADNDVIEADDIVNSSTDCALIEYKGIFTFLESHVYVIRLGPSDTCPNVSMLIPAVPEDS
jgi:hypothetical protein